MKRVIIANDNEDHLAAVRSAVQFVCTLHGEECLIREIRAKSVEAAAGEMRELLENFNESPYDLIVLDILYPGDTLGGIHLWSDIPKGLQERGGFLLVVSNSENPAISTFAVAHHGAVIAVNPNRILKQKIGQVLGFPPTVYTA